MSAPVEVVETSFMRPDLPLHLEVQVLAFARIVWDDAFIGEDRFRDRLYDEPEAVHFVRTMGVLLVSHVEVDAVLTQAGNGRAMRIGAVGGVMTYPEFRREGHASALLREAEAYIRRDGFDLGMLFCDLENEPFYEALGWRPLPRGRVLVDGHVPDDRIMTLGDATSLPPVLALDHSW